MKTTCPGCLRGLPLHNGIHCGEFEYIACTANKNLSGEGFELVPKEHDTWHDEKARKRGKAPFTFGRVA